MEKNKPSIPLDTLTYHFLKFAKTIGIYPRIVASYYKYCEKSIVLSFWVNYNMLYNVKSNQIIDFYDYVQCQCRYYSTLNEELVKRVFLFQEPHWFYDNFNVEKPYFYKENDDITKLFFSYLKDYGYHRYTKITNKIF